MVHCLRVATAAKGIYAHGHRVRRATELLRAELLHLGVSKRRVHLLAGRRSMQGAAGGRRVGCRRRELRRLLLGGGLLLHRRLVLVHQLLVRLRCLRFMAMPDRVVDCCAAKTVRLRAWNVVRAHAERRGQGNIRLSWMFRHYLPPRPHLLLHQLLLLHLVLCHQILLRLVLRLQRGRLWGLLPWLRRR